MTLQAHHRERVRATMERRRLSCKDVSLYTGLCERTIQRFVEGRTFNLDTLRRIEEALRIREGGEGITSDSVPANHRKSPQGPVMGWEQAASGLGMSVDTLERRRRRHGGMDREPWWKDTESLMRWYQRMIGQEEP